MESTARERPAGDRRVRSEIIAVGQRLAAGALRLVRRREKARDRAEHAMEDACI